MINIKFSYYHILFCDNLELEKTYDLADFYEYDYYKLVSL